MGRTAEGGMHYLFSFLVIVGTSQTVWAQTANTKYQMPNSSRVALVHSKSFNTLQTIDSLRIDTQSEKPQPSPSPLRGYQSTKSPALAVLLSTVAPGAGQIYNESYWKPPIIWGLGGYWVYEWIQLNDKYRDFRGQYTMNSSNALTKRLRDFYRDERDRFAWYLGALYFLNLVDAYVGANLYDFNVSPELGTDGAVVPKVIVTIHFGF